MSARKQIPVSGTSTPAGASRRAVAVGEDLVPVPTPSAYTVAVDGEAVVLDEATDRLHLLNATAALVWACFDGRSTLREICTDLAEGLGTPYATVLADTEAITARLLDEGLLVDPDAREPAEPEAPDASDELAAAAAPGAEPPPERADGPRLLEEPPNP